MDVSADRRDNSLGPETIVGGFRPCPYPFRRSLLPRVARFRKGRRPAGACGRSQRTFRKPLEYSPRSTRVLAAEYAGALRTAFPVFPVLFARFRAWSRRASWLVLVGGVEFGGVCSCRCRTEEQKGLILFDKHPVCPLPRWKRLFPFRAECFCFLPCAVIIFFITCREFSVGAAGRRCMPCGRGASVARSFSRSSGWISPLTGPMTTLSIIQNCL